MFPFEEPLEPEWDEPFKRLTGWLASADRPDVSEEGIVCDIGSIRPSDTYEPGRLWVSVAFVPFAPRSHDLNTTSGSLDEAVRGIKSGCLSCRFSILRRPVRIAVSAEACVAGAVWPPEVLSDG